MEEAGTDVAPPAAPAAAPLSYARPTSTLPYARATWPQIRRAAWRSAIDTALTGGWVIVSLLVLLMVVGGVAAWQVGIDVPAWVFIVTAMVGVALTIAAAGLAGFGAFRLKIERECKAAGMCVRCGYDLRASEGRCPECGKRTGRRPPSPRDGL